MVSDRAHASRFTACLSNHPRITLAGILLAGLLIRWFVFDQVAVWGDVGFYPYNAQQIAAGQRPFIDFIGRSPLFLYAITPLFEAALNNIVWGRWFIILVWGLVALLVYQYGVVAHSPRVGLLAAGLFWLLPYNWVFGMWFNTQAMGALFVMAALLVYATYAWRRRPALAFTTVGLLLAAAFLVRRSAVVATIAIVLFIAWETYHDDRPLRSAAAAYGLLAAGFTAGLIAMYAIVARGAPSLTVELFNTHVVMLVESHGRGGFAMAGSDVALVRQLGVGRIPIFNDYLCQLCGPQTVVRLIKTLLLIVPVAGAVTVYIRFFFDQATEHGPNTYLMAVVATLYLYALALVAMAGYWLRLAAFVLLGAAVVIAWRAPPPRRSDLWTRPVQLGLLFTTGVLAAYLYRNRMIHVYYFLDLYPMLCVLASVAVTAVYDRYDDPDVTPGISRRDALSAAHAILVIGLAIGLLASYPLMDVITGNEPGWQTVDSIEAYGEDIEQRTAPSEQVFVSLPAYTANADREVALDVVRLHYIASAYPNSSYGQQVEHRLQAGFAHGHFPIAIMDDGASRILDRWPAANASFHANYCPAPAAEQSLYQRTNATLWVYSEEAPSCD